MRERPGVVGTLDQMPRCTGAIAAALFWSGGSGLCGDPMRVLCLER